MWLISDILDGRCIDFPWKVAVFSTLDAHSGYLHVTVEKKDLYNTTFTSHHGLYRFVQMPFVLEKKVLRNFWCATDVILSPAKFQFALVYFDTIIVFRAHRATSLNIWVASCQSYKMQGLPWGWRNTSSLPLQLITLVMLYHQVA